jgi:hypothetical protein
LIVVYILYWPYCLFEHETLIKHDLLIVI